MSDVSIRTGITVVIPPSGKQGEDLFAVAEQWTELGMLNISIWVQNLDALTSEQHPPRQLARVLGTSKSGDITTKELDLFEMFAGQPMMSVRLVAVRNSVANVEHDELQDRLVDLITKYLESSLASRSSAADQSAVSTRLEKINLVTATTQHVSAHKTSIVGQQYNLNIIASTEDRSSPLSGDAFVHYEPDSLRFAGHTMLHLASVGGLWAGLPMDFVDLVKPEGWTGNRAYVSRAFTSAVLTEGLARRVSSRVLKRAANAQEGFSNLSFEIPIPGTYPIADDDADAFVEHMAKQTFIFDQAKLDFQSAATATNPDKMRFSFWGQIRDFISFSWDKVIQIPYYAIRWVWKSIVDGMNRVFQGGDKGSGFIATPEDKLDKRDELLQEKRRQIQRVATRADETLNSPITPSQVRSTPDLWSNIRKLVFGILDGSNLEKFEFTKADNGWPIFYRVASVFPDPTIKLSVPDPTDKAATVNLDWGNLSNSRDVVEAYAQANRELDSGIKNGVQELVQLKARLENAKRQIKQDTSTLQRIRATASLNDGEL